MPSFPYLVTIFVSGALSLTVITLNRVIGIAMPRVADVLELNRFIVYTILVVIWLISIGTAVPTYLYQAYQVGSYWNLNQEYSDEDSIENVCFRLQNSRIILYSAANKVKNIKLFLRAFSFFFVQCISFQNWYHLMRVARI